VSLSRSSALIVLPFSAAPMKTPDVPDRTWAVAGVLTIPCASTDGVLTLTWLEDHGAMSFG